MATYRRGFKKTTPEQMLLRVIVGIIAVVFVFVIAAYLYASTYGSWEYENYTHLTAYETLLTQEDENEDQLQDYVLYFYGSGCESCLDIKNKVMRYTDKINSDSTMVYFVDIENMDDEDEYLDTFLDDISKSTLTTPMLVVVANGDFYEWVSGTDDVVNLLKQIKDGEYEPFND
ncbi:MAG TPA: hypothetical protein PLH02_01270 [Bacillota bacterium]|nr:hypothetical protein [Bacillota bacterium]HPF42868.1 hypothetical protein [Bacillota bacterium]HPJ86098.1 hypothetical protein [Bacillota bacterium]HPQ61495.1 hypothetical protein [Bacillota bacterium]HRX92066.1 hypothetical protein [Candidatus Izemoplasmatales bacterium]